MRIYLYKFSLKNYYFYSIYNLVSTIIKWDLLKLNFFLIALFVIYKMNLKIKNLWHNEHWFNFFRNIFKIIFVQVFTDTFSFLL